MYTFSHLFFSCRATMANFGPVELGLTKQFKSEQLLITEAPLGPNGEEMVYTWSQGRKPYERKDGVKRYTVRCTECWSLKKNNDFPVTSFFL